MEELSEILLNNKCILNTKKVTMKRSLNILTILAFTIFLSSFTGKPADQFVGTYGVSSSDPSQIKLILHSDQTFYYQDFSISDRKIIARGSWTSEGKKVVLKDIDSDQQFHDVWTFENNGQVAKSRRGLTFYRLAKMNQE